MCVCVWGGGGGGGEGRGGEEGLDGVSMWCVITIMHLYYYFRKEEAKLSVR